MNLHTIILQAAPATPTGGGGMQTLIMFALIIFVFYFFMIRPQTKKAKEAKKFRENLEKGQRVVTIGGIHGRIEEVKDTTVIISTEAGGKLRVEKAAISQEFSSNLKDELKS
jgi:preprotein translocase subunit YajC